MHYSGVLGHKKTHLISVDSRFDFNMDMNNRTYFHRQSVAYLHAINNIAAQVGW